MHIDKNDIPVRIDVPGAVARQTDAFGELSGAGALGGEYFSLGAGTDIAPLLAGLEGDACQAPHWGYLISGGSSSPTPTAPRRPARGTSSSSGRRATACASSTTPR